ncbi:hypothetical protein SODALDRAFT_271994 [Sodiomyces alkalinus F11]|uniref:Arrestin n=1 Tax=Sodiomyces alkalinus (strain CBS 110278 / VKM F-3762 / F11) TaxID=1314773 RepID=A0A3N2Q1M1_SODAK|nr:hypothetical protein SODALDRAFT_271994 [Sodiomyces alkalinus F11]ROT40657.1 hypothetical protein SODALDRAFT_271994 [Sodiomyces alkalinus F11]
MSAASDMSTALTFSRPILPKGPNIQIKLHDDYRAKIFNSGSPVSGDVVITPWRDTRFDIVSIALIGRASSRVDAAQLSHHSSHTFLKMNMPIPESAYPTPRVFEAGRTYTIPFHFVIPQQLTLSACNHKKQSVFVHDQHMRLPPSMGHWSFDDFSPDMTRIEYLVKARVAEQPDLDDLPLKLMEADRRINVLPTSIEDPPLNITPQDRQYRLTKSKTLRKNIFSGKQGVLTATAAQPAALRVASDFRGSAETSVLVNLSFAPHAPEIAPPKVNRVSAKLQSTTWFSPTPMPVPPNMGDSRQSALTGLSQLSYSMAIGSASSTDMEPTSWQMRPTSITRRDSGYSSEGHHEGHPDSPSDSDHGSNRHPHKPNSGSGGAKAPFYHETTIRVPFKVMTSRKLLLPTFHTCLISRTYTLQLAVTVADTKVNLMVPVQVAVQPSATPQQLSLDPGLPSFDAAMEQREQMEADELLQPRFLGQPYLSPQERSGLPAYNEFSLRRPAMTAT